MTTYELKRYFDINQHSKIRIRQQIMIDSEIIVIALKSESIREQGVRRVLREPRVDGRRIRRRCTLHKTRLSYYTHAVSCQYVTRRLLTLERILCT